jgi:hypothetical protein
MTTDPRPRGVLFHWVANIFFASLALLAGVIFGERIPREKYGLVFVIIALGALLLVPLTRSWERAGIEKRRRAQQGADEAEVSEVSEPEDPGKD